MSLPLTRRLPVVALRQSTSASLRQSVKFQPAIAILLARRPVSTETSRQTGNDTYPPPGFDANKAKQPASKDASSLPKIEIPVKEPTSEAPTQANIDASINQLAQAKAVHERNSNKSLEKKKADDVKLTLRQKIMKEVHHYWDGTKLLAAEVKISSKLAAKMTAGYELTRREHRQLQRTVQDLGRLVPFSVFVIVPFAELLLPVALKLFPNMLPSTYEGQKSKDNKAASLRSTRKEVSSFLRQTLQESGLPVSAANAQSDEFTEFFKKVRATGESPTTDDVIRVCKIFKDDLTLDNLSRPQLVGICRYMSLTNFGTDAMLRYQIRHRMRQIKRDDKAIAYEGTETLSIPELQTACASRGLRTHHMSPEKLRDDLGMWLDLRLKHGIPSTLLVLSNAFMYAQGKELEFDSQIDALVAVLSSIPEELFHEIELEVHTAEGSVTNKQRLEVLREQQELIDEENEQSEAEKEDGRETNVDDRENIDEKDEEARQEAALQAGGKKADESKLEASAQSAETRTEQPSETGDQSAKDKRP